MTASSSSPLHVVIGATGQIGRHLVRALAASGARIREVARTPAPGAAVHGREHAHGDIGDAAEATRLCAGAGVVYACFGGPHHTWSMEYPRMTRGLLTGAARAGARVVFVDNLYAYGPQDAPLTEDTRPRPTGTKPRLRRAIAEGFLAAHARGDVEVAIARASDLYGPGVEHAMAGAALVADALAGRTIYVPGDLDAPHTFTYAPDVARAMVELAGADDVWGQIWHVPSAPAVSLRELVRRVAALGGTSSRVRGIPMVVVRLAALFRRDVRELIELAYQWDRPYLVSHARFDARFGTAPTSIDDGLRATCAWLHRRAGQGVPDRSGVRSSPPRPSSPR